MLFASLTKALLSDTLHSLCPQQCSANLPLGKLEISISLTIKGLTWDFYLQFTLNIHLLSSTKCQDCQNFALTGKFASEIAVETAMPGNEAHLTEN